MHRYDGFLALSPGYYISYALSIVPSIELHGFAKTNREDAAANYLTLLKNDGDSRDVLTDAGLYDSFTSDAYVTVASAFLQ